MTKNTSIAENGVVSQMGEDFVRVGQLNDFAVGSMKKVSVNGEDVLVTNVDGILCAIGNTCTHLGAPLDEGELQGSVVTCPWHGGQFDVKNGKTLAPPPTADEHSYEVKIQGIDVLLRKK
jgi:nitrite reductase/ring-hydroxylating ferredoxin subunit